MRKFPRKAPAALGKWAKRGAKTGAVLAEIAAIGAPALPANAVSGFERCAEAEAGSVIIGSVCVGAMGMAAPACATAAALFFLEPVSAAACAAAATSAGASCPISVRKIARVAARCRYDAGLRGGRGRARSGTESERREAGSRPRRPLVSFSRSMPESRPNPLISHRIHDHPL